MAISDTHFDTRLTPQERAALERAPKLRPEQQWWNLPAKYAAARRIADEELDRASAMAFPNRPHNDQYDAMRHARWSQRMAKEIDPLTALVVGAGHEFTGYLKGQPDAEALMDKRNNAEGRRAAAEGRPVNPANLQTRLDSPSLGNPQYRQARPRGGAAVGDDLDRKL